MKYSFNLLLFSLTAIATLFLSRSIYQNTIDYYTEQHLEDQKDIARFREGMESCLKWNARATTTTFNSKTTTTTFDIPLKWKVQRVNPKK